MNTRYSFGGDEHVFVELDEEMSLDAFFKALALSDAVREAKIEGITEVCPANASFQVRFDPDIIDHDSVMQKLKELEAKASSSPSRLSTRIVEIPVLYQDPWTHETLMRFRDRHQDPDGTDLSYAARINGFDSVEAFIEAHHASPWFVTMVGFVAGLPFLYQLVERERQIQVPKYLRPRTDTPKQTVGYGGCFSCIYSVKGAGGYQMFGVTPMPIYDPTETVSYLKDFMVFFKPGDLVKWKPVDRAEYDRILAALETNSYEPRIRTAEFDLEAFKKNPDAYNASLLEVLHDD